MLDYCHTFKEIAINVTERIDPKKNKNTPYIGLEHLQQNSFNPKELGTSEEVEGQKFIMQKGDVLFGRRRAYQRKVGIAPCNGMFSAHGMILRPKTNVIVSELLPFFIRSDAFMKEAINRSSGSLSPTLNWKDIQNIHFKIPVKDEQLRISGILWKLEELKENYLARSVLLDELVKSRFIEMFGSLNNNKFGFKVVALEELFEFIKDGTHQTPTYTEDSESGFKFLSSKDVVTGKIDWSNIKYIPRELHEELYSHLAPRRNDILLAKNGTTGIAAKVDTDEIFDIYVSLALMRPLPGNNVDFLVESINQPTTKRQFNSRLKGIGVPNLHLGEIKKTKILLPPLELQNQFVRFLNQVDKSKSMLNKQIEKTIKLQQSILNNNIKCVE